MANAFLPARALGVHAMALAVVLAAMPGMPVRAADAGGRVAASDAVLREAMRERAALPRAPLIPRARLLTPPAIADVQLSPDGERLAVLRRDGARFDVQVRTVAGGQAAVALRGSTGARIAWSGDGRRLWIDDENGLAAFDVRRGSTQRVLKWDPRRRQRLWKIDPRAPGVVVVHETVAADDGAGERHRYLRIDAAGATRLLHEAERPLTGALLDADGGLAYVAAFDGPAYELSIRRMTPAGARELRRCTGVDACVLAGFDAAGLWLLSQHGEDTLALQRWTAADGRWRTLHRDPEADADALLWSPARDTWVAVRAGGRWHGADAATRARLAAVARRLPGATTRLAASADGRRWLVEAHRATWREPRHFLHDQGSQQLTPLLADAADDAIAGALAPMHPIAWRGRDGMLLHGWVLLPAGVPAAEAPLVAWLHGGPVAHVDDGHDPRLQLLANRGYAVFVPNFRGSTGRGKRYLLAAKGDVGDGVVLADIVAGMDHALALGIGDPARQAVMGHSFGGYASLLAASHHPRRFRVVFAAAPPTDYGWIKQWQAEHDHAGLRGEGPPVALQFIRLGFRYDDATWRRRMREQSPLARAAALRTPVYLWAGAKDDRVPLPSVANFVGELRRHERPLALLVDPQAGHSPDDRLGREALVHLYELAGHRELGGPLEPASEELAAYLGRTMRIDDFRGEPARAR